MKATVFLGGGRITEAGGGPAARGDQRRIVVYDRNPKAAALRKESHIEIAYDLQSAVAKAGLLIIAVRPGSVK
jgi:pyrroline-5-carboxylate reductase